MKICLFLVLGLLLAEPANPQPEVLQWTQLTPLPDAVGFAGSFAGISGDALIVAGGANFPDLPPWEGGTKVWYDSIFVLAQPDGVWRRAGQLPRASGYGVSLTTTDGILFIGGSDAHEHSTTVLRVRWQDDELHQENLPPLPVPLAMASGAVLHDVVYIAGGLDHPDAQSAQRLFLALDLKNLPAGWQSLPPWPGPERFLATAGGVDDTFYLFGGAKLIEGTDGKPSREWLQDSWSFNPQSGWRRLADLPKPWVAAPAPAPGLGPSHLLLIGGDDGSSVSRPPAEHAGFLRELWAYHTITDTWSQMGSLPFSLVTTPAVKWGERLIIPGGEARPGVRSTAVWSGGPALSRRTFGWFNYTTLGLYLGLIAAVGLWFMRRQKSTDDYFKAGGRVPWWAAGLSIFATMLSSITFMAIPAKAYATDWIFAVSNLAVLAVAPIVIAFYLPFFRRINVTSAYEYLERRFNLAVRLYASASFILFQLGRMAVVMLLPALALSAAVGLDLHLSILLIGVTCSIYTAAGGIEAVIWTDAVQSIVLLGAAVLTLLLLAVHLEGSPSEWWMQAAAAGKLRAVDWSWDLTTASFFVVVVGSLFTNLAPYTADQSVVQRYLTTSDVHQASRAIRLNAWLTVPATILFFTIGTGLYLFYRQHPQSLDPGLSTDTILPLFIVGFMPPGVAGVVIAGIFAAAQSTASSSVNSIVTAVTTDWVRRFRPTLSDRFCLQLSRILSVTIGFCGTGFALYLATTNLRSLWDTYLSLLGLLGSGLAGLFALGIFTRRASGPGALIGALTSAVVLYFVQKNSDLHFLLYGAVGTLGTFVVGWIASLFIPTRPTNLDGLTWSAPQRST